MSQSTLNVDVSNDAGQRIKVHSNFHVNQVDGEVVAVVDSFFAWCVGRPSW